MTRLVLLRKQMHLATTWSLQWVNIIRAGEHHDGSDVSQGSDRGLPQALRTAQAAIHLSEVQEMLCRLSEYKLGVFMPHMHDEQTGEFQPLPDNVMQVESGLKVSFQSTEEIVNQTERFLAVGWRWRDGASTPVAACEMVREEEPGDTERYVKHKMTVS